MKASLLALDAKNEPAFLVTIADDAVLDELMLSQPFVGKRSVKTWFQTWTSSRADGTAGARSS